MLKKQFYIKSWHSFRYSSGYWSLITDYYLDYKLGGLGLHASERLYGAAWADALPVLAARLPQLAERCVAALGDDSPVPCLREAAQSGSFLERQGWQSRPPWDTLTHLPRPPPTLAEREPELPADGWQHLATLVVQTSFRERELPARALLRSQAGPHAGASRHAHRVAAASPRTPAGDCCPVRRRA